jgi:hypothetical protein
MLQYGMETAALQLVLLLESKGLAWEKENDS